VNQLVNTVCPFCREALQPHTVHNETSLLERPTKRAKIARETDADGTTSQALTFQED
jgi:hypothetical protein